MYYYIIAINCPKGEVLRPFFKKYRKLKIFVHFYDFYVRYGKRLGHFLDLQKQKKITNVRPSIFQRQKQNDTNKNIL